MFHSLGKYVDFSSFLDSRGKIIDSFLKEPIIEGLDQPPTNCTSQIGCSGDSTTCLTHTDPYMTKKLVCSTPSPGSNPNRIVAQASPAQCFSKTLATGAPPPTGGTCYRNSNNQCNNTTSDCIRIPQGQVVEQCNNRQKTIVYGNTEKRPPPSNISNISSITASSINISPRPSPFYFNVADPIYIDDINPTASPKCQIKGDYSITYVLPWHSNRIIGVSPVPSSTNPTNCSLHKLTNAVTCEDCQSDEIAVKSIGTSSSTNIDSLFSLSPSLGPRRVDYTSLTTTNRSDFQSAIDPINAVQSSPTLYKKGNNYYLKSDNLPQLTSKYDSCITCPSGYTKNGEECQYNICNCVNGTPARGTPCPSTNYNRCSTCNNGYHPVSSPPSQVITCSLNQCTCQNGTPNTGTSCQTDGNESCAQCSSGYYAIQSPNPGPTVCRQNICTCVDNNNLSIGSPARGSACPTNDRSKCISCTPGRFLMSGVCEHCQAGRWSQGGVGNFCGTSTIYECANGTDSSPGPLRTGPAQCQEDGCNSGYYHTGSSSSSPRRCLPYQGSCTNGKLIATPSRRYNDHCSSQCDGGHYPSRSELGSSASSPVRCLPYSGNCTHGTARAQASRQYNDHCSSQCSLGYTNSPPQPGSSSSPVRCLAYAGTCQYGTLIATPGRLYDDHCGSCDSGYGISPGSSPAVCTPNRCVCSGGTPHVGKATAAVPTDCPSPSAEKCSSCNSTHVLRTSDFTCRPKTCICTIDGTVSGTSIGTSGSGCTTTNQQNCASCTPNYQYVTNITGFPTGGGNCYPVCNTPGQKYVVSPSPAGCKTICNLTDSSNNNLTLTQSSPTPHYTNNTIGYNIVYTSQKPLNGTIDVITTNATSNPTTGTLATQQTGFTFDDLKQHTIRIKNGWWLKNQNGFNLTCNSNNNLTLAGDINECDRYNSLPNNHSKYNSCAVYNQNECSRYITVTTSPSPATPFPRVSSASQIPDYSNAIDKRFKICDTPNPGYYFGTEKDSVWRDSSGKSLEYKKFTYDTNTNQWTGQ